METLRHGNIAPWRHGDKERGNKDNEARTWRHGRGDMDRETWTWRHGHRDKEMETWTWRHGH
jgi:hypothetical protein